MVSGSVFADGVIRIMAANITSGNRQSYDPGHGNRIFQGLRPDVALVQEMNYRDNSDADFRKWVDENFGPEFSYYRESGEGIPNGIVSRYPILEAGEWDDVTMTERDFVWARLDIPGDRDLWVISVHLKASSGSSSQRKAQAEALLEFISKQIPEADLIALGGDFNTHSRTEPCVEVLEEAFKTDAPWPLDTLGDGDTNLKRTSPYDWVIADEDLEKYKAPLVIGSRRFPDGLVFDSRSYEPLSEVPPIQSEDSAAPGMQHMAVMRAFAIPTTEGKP